MALPSSPAGVQIVRPGSSATTEWISRRRRRRKTRLVAWSPPLGVDGRRRRDTDSTVTSVHSATDACLPALDTPGDSGTQELQANAPDVSSLLTTPTQTSENHRDVRIHGAASKLLKSELSSRDHRYRRPAASTTSRSRLQRTRHSQNAPLLHDLASYGAHDDSTGISSLSTFE